MALLANNGLTICDICNVCSVALQGELIISQNVFLLYFFVAVDITGFRKLFLIYYKFRLVSSDIVFHLMFSL